MDNNEICTKLLKKKKNSKLTDNISGNKIFSLWSVNFFTKLYKMITVYKISASIEFAFFFVQTN